MFEDRKDAGQQLGRALEDTRDLHPLVLGIPRGGVEVAAQVARYLKADLSVLISRKLPLPGEPEAGFGAIAEDGSRYLMGSITYDLPVEMMESVIREQKEVIRRYLRLFRGGRSLPVIEGRTVILVDDGIAMGSTMLAAARMLRREKAAFIVAAAPVSGKDLPASFDHLMNRTVVLERPKDFHAVAQAYRHWSEVTDEETVRILKEAGILQRDK